MRALLGLPRRRRRHRRRHGAGTAHPFNSQPARRGDRESSVRTCCTEWAQALAARRGCRRVGVEGQLVRESKLTRGPGKTVESPVRTARESVHELDAGDEVQEQADDVREREEGQSPVPESTLSPRPLIGHRFPPAPDLTRRTDTASHAQHAQAQGITSSATSEPVGRRAKPLSGSSAGDPTFASRLGRPSTLPPGVARVLAR